MKILIVLLLLSFFIGCQTIPEKDFFDGKLSETEAGYIVMAVCDVIAAGLVIYGVTSMPEMKPRLNPNDPYYEGE